MIGERPDRGEGQEGPPAPFELECSCGMTFRGSRAECFYQRRKHWRSFPEHRASAPYRETKPSWE